MNPLTRSLQQPWRPAAQVALVYAVVGMAWILGSDRLALLIAQGDPATLSEIQQYKGLFFVAMSSILIFLLVYAEHRRLARAQRALSLREHELRQAQKMEAVGLLAGGVAHDFNNVLQVIHGHAELALDDAGTDPRSRASLKEIAGASQRGARLVSQLLAFSRRQILEPADIDLNDVVGSLLELIRRTLGADVRVEFTPDRSLAPLHADRGQLEQVLLNLCLNARDAMPGGGVLTVTTQAVTFGAAADDLPPWARPGRFALLRVADTGCGMDADTLTRIWEPFFTTKEPGKGTGLGLSTAHGIIHQHQGLVHVESERGRGTTFSIYLPIRPPA